MRKMKAAEIVLDFSLYPRHQVDQHHVSSLVQALAAECELPPIVICRKSKRCVDGFHRTKAYLRHFGEGVEVYVAEKSYKSDQELFLDAMRYNAAHGRALSTFDKAHCAILAGNLGIDDSMVGDALHIDTAYVGELRVDRAAYSGALHVPIKRTIKHMAGKKLTKHQAEVNEKLSGMQQRFYVNQVAMLIESGLLDTNDEELMKDVGKLGELIAGIAVNA